MAGIDATATPGDVYRLGYRWLIKGPIEVVFDLLTHARDYPVLWSPCFKAAESDDEVDTIVRLSGRFPLRGPIRYTTAEGPDGVEVVNDQVIVSERRLPRPLRALLQRAFAYNHAWAFRVGGRGLQRAVDEAVAARGAGATVA